ncbi:MAG: M23 family metallopeptidase [Bacteroidales bacterium]|jgi:murein DD-endopeptidase MepM/ murein hydrolase activator NlpD|nr:M23 family metallopeptidase [Bacteroidales bacterium]
MAQVKYKYNPESLSYDKIERSAKGVAKRMLFFVTASLTLGVVYIIILSLFFVTPKEKKLLNDLDHITVNYKMLDQRMDQMLKVVNDMQQRDDNIYRTVFELEPIPQSIRQAGFGGINRYESLEGFVNSPLMIRTNKFIDKLTKQVYVQSKSYDELIDRVKNQEQMLAARPAIQPIDNRDLKKTASGYGMRIHPIHKDLRFHNGMDFAAPVGTDIYVTGDGVVTQTGYSGGLGNRIIVNHGFGYKTVYGHLSGFAVREGDAVKRGQVIGYVGNTGDSTGPHLHYEVHKNDQIVNPINYYYEDLSPEEFALIVDMASKGAIYD